MTTPTLSFGTQITSANDVLRPLSTREMYALVTTDTALQRTTERLRAVQSLDKEAYRTAKTRLPYVVGSTFVADAEGRLVRRTTAFEAAHYFILDLDNCPGLAGQVPDAVRQNEYVELAFVSPGGNGLKLFFRLLEPFLATHGTGVPKQFTAAYRAFAAHIGEQFRWANSLDLRTCDVTRACFLAHDPSAYFNPEAMPVDARLWRVEADELPQQPVQVGEEAHAGRDGATQRRPAAERPIDPIAYQRVLKQVNPHTTAVRPARQTHVPDALHPLEPDVRLICERLGWTLTAVQPLNYGLKFMIQQGFRTAEVNVFWGKRGYSVVKSPKTGTDPDLSGLFCEQLVALLFPPAVVGPGVLPTHDFSLN